MPNYKVTDPETGKSFIFSGDSDTPPTNEEINSYLAQQGNSTPMGIGGTPLGMNGMSVAGMTIPIGKRGSMRLTNPRAGNDQVQIAAQKDEAIRNRKLQGLSQAVDFFEQKINELPVGTGLQGRLDGMALAAKGALQFNPMNPNDKTPAKAAAYNADVQGMRSQIARGLGEVGNLSEYEQKYAIGLLPKMTDNAETRQQKIANFRDYISKKLGLATKDGVQITPELNTAIQAAGIKGSIKSIKKVK